jgi:hypothetical protein
MSRKWEFSATIPVGDVEFDFFGTWIPYQPATYWQPAEGGYFDEYEIHHKNHDFTDLLSDKTTERILDKARDEYIERVR